VAHSDRSHFIPTEPQGGSQGWLIWAGWLLLAGLCLLALRWTALVFNATDLFFDEAQYWAWSLEPAFGYYSKPPLIAWLIAAATSVCGHDAACVRAPSALLYVFAAFGVFLAASQLYGPKTGFLSGLVFATVPGVSLSSGIISTDVPLLAVWAFALAALIALVRGAGWWSAIALGLALGVGLNAKYAMAYFVLCLIVYAVAVPQQRRLLGDPKIWTAVGIGLVLIVPNVLWNLDNGFATVSHTADNAKWDGQLGHPEKALEFFASQFGVFGPILFGGLLVICWRAWREGLSDGDALLFSFAVPVIVIVTVQAFLSRAHANWAAVSYVAAAILLTATMVRRADWRWFNASLGLHFVVLVLLAIGVALAGRFVLPGGADPFARTLGWNRLSDVVHEKVKQSAASGKPVKAILSDTRALSAELIYYLRDATAPRVLAWRGPGVPRDHFAMKRPYAGPAPEPVLLVSLREAKRSKILGYFATVEPIGQIEVPAGLATTRTVWFARLSGFKGY